MTHFASQFFMTEDELLNFHQSLADPARDEVTLEALGREPKKPIDWRKIVKSINPQLATSFYERLDAIRGTPIIIFCKLQIAQVMWQASSGVLLIDPDSTGVTKELNRISDIANSLATALQKLSSDYDYPIEEALGRDFYQHGETCVLRHDALLKFKEAAQFTANVLDSARVRANASAHKQRERTSVMLQMKSRAQERVLKVVLDAFGIDHPNFKRTNSTDSDDDPSQPKGPLAEYLEVIWEHLPKTVRPGKPRTFVLRGYRMHPSTRRSPRSQKNVPHRKIS